jgi:molybdopterin molybdotransferase
MNGLLNVDVALGQILAQISQLSPEVISLEDALDRVLAQDIFAQENLPPFPVSSMDGFGVVAEDVHTASHQTPVSLLICGEVQAGDVSPITLQRGQAIKIMTGAAVPAGVTAVIPIEDTDADWQIPMTHVTVYASAQAGDNIRPIGENINVGQEIFKAGHGLRPQDIGLLAALGMAQLPVIKRPHVVVISTGDELLDVDSAPQHGKIRDSNSYILANLVKSYGANVTRLPIVRDTEQDVRTAFEQAIAHKPDMIISSGGVSVGAVDFVRTILEEMGQINFWRINFRPGKPLAFGTLHGIPFFGLPGNPVSVLVTFDVMVRPALLKQMNKPDSVPLQTAILKESVNSDGRRSYVRVKLSLQDGQLMATTTGTQSSGALFSMVIADGLLILPEGVTVAQAGKAFPVRLLRTL